MHNTLSLEKKLIKGYVSVNKDKTILFSVAPTEDEALNGAYKLSETVWEDVPSRSLKEDNIPLEILPASYAVVQNAMISRNIIDWMEYEGCAISRKEATALGVWEKDTSKLFFVSPGITGLAYDPDTAILMAKYMGLYNKPPFIAEEVDRLSVEDYRRYINNPSMPDKFYPDKNFPFRLINYPHKNSWQGHIVKKLTLVRKNENALLIADNNDSENNLTIELCNVCLWQLEMIMEENAKFYYVNNGPECWRRMCGRASVIMLNKYDAYEFPYMMN